MDTTVRFFDADAVRAERPTGRITRSSLTSLALAVGLVLAVSFVPGGNVAAADPSATDWQRLRVCESGDNYAINTGNGYYGAYQFDLGTWRSVGGTGYPHQASKATQDALALALWRQRGWSPWACASIVGLTNTPRTVPPIGHVDAVKVAATTATIAGWALDTNHASTSIGVHVYVNGVGRAFAANQARADVNRAYGATGRHGFGLTVPINRGANTICVYSIGVDPNNNTLLACRVYQSAGLTTGHVDGANATQATATVSGWAVDPNAPSVSIPVHVYVDSGGVRTSFTATTANIARPDVNRVRGVTGSHGFRVTVPLEPGINRVCSYSVGTLPGTNALIQCRLVESRMSIRGSVDRVAAGASSAVVAGWAFDPNYPNQSISVHVYVNGNPVIFRAGQNRTDVNRVFSVAGAHGFSGSVPLKSGQNRICVYGISLVVKNNGLLACRDVSTIAPKTVLRAVAPAAEPPAVAASTTSPQTATSAGTADLTTVDVAPRSAKPAGEPTTLPAPTLPAAPTAAAPTAAAQTTPAPTTAASDHCSTDHCSTDHGSADNCGADNLAAGDVRCAALHRVHHTHRCASVEGRPREPRSGRNSRNADRVDRRPVGRAGGLLGADHCQRCDP